MSDFITKDPAVPAAVPAEQGYPLPPSPQPIAPAGGPALTPAQRLRAAILGYEDIGSELVPVPQWNGMEVLVRGMSAGERNVLAQKARVNSEDGKAKTDPNKFYPLIVIATATEPTTGEQVFTADDATNIMGKSGGAVDLLATTALRLSGLNVEKGQEAVEVAVEEAGKASSSGPGATPEATSN